LIQLFSLTNHGLRKIDPRCLTGICSRRRPTPQRAAAAEM
jgi:hypothetical protein